MLTFSEMVALANQIRPFLFGFTVTKVRELGGKKWDFTFVQGTKEQTLLVSACVPFSRFHLARRSSTGKQSKFTQALEEKLIGSVFQNIELLNGDRIVAITFEKKGEKLTWIAELCFKHPRVVLVNSSYQILASWESISECEYHLPQRVKQQVAEMVSIDSLSVEEDYREREKKAEFESKLKWVSGQLEKKIIKGDERLQRHQAEKEEALKWEEKTHLGQLLQSHFHLLKRGMSSIVIEDWEKNGEKREIPLDPLMEPQELVQRCFKEARKLRKRGELIDSLIDKAKGEVKRLSELKDQLLQAKSEHDLDRVIGQAGIIQQRRSDRSKETKMRSPYREFVTEAGLSIFIGRSDRDNDRLSLSFAHGNDRWFHAANVPGSHVVLKMPRSGMIDQESLQDAFQLALYFSKAKDRGEDDVVMTECKYLSKSKGSKPGLVNLSKHKSVRIRLDQKRIDRLLGKNIV